MAHFKVIVVLLNARPKLHLLYFDRVLFLPRFAGCPSRFVSILSVVHHLDDGRPGIRSNLYQIHPTIRSPLTGLIDGNDADLFTIVLDKPYRADPNLLIYARSSFADFLSTSFSGKPGGRQASF